MPGAQLGPGSLGAALTPALQTGLYCLLLLLLYNPCLTCDCSLSASTWSLFALALPQPAVTSVVMRTESCHCCDCHDSSAQAACPCECQGFVLGKALLAENIWSMEQFYCFLSAALCRNRLQERLQCSNGIKPCVSSVAQRSADMT